MTDPVISLSRLRENVPPAHEPGMADARARLRVAMADESRAAAATAQPYVNARSTRSLGWHRSAGRLQMAGALAMALAVIAVSANQLSPPAAGNADAIAARNMARTVTSLAALAKIAAHDDPSRARRRSGAPTGGPAGPALVLPQAEPGDPADDEDPVADAPAAEPTGPVSDVPEDGTAAPDDESSGDTGDPSSGGDTPSDGSTSPGDPGSPPADMPPAGGKTIVPGP